MLLSSRLVSLTYQHLYIFSPLSFPPDPRWPLHTKNPLPPFAPSPFCPFAPATLLPSPRSPVHCPSTALSSSPPLSPPLPPSSLFLLFFPLSSLISGSFLFSLLPLPPPSLFLLFFLLSSLLSCTLLFSPLLPFPLLSPPFPPPNFALRFPPLPFPSFLPTTSFLFLLLLRPISVHSSFTELLSLTSPPPFLPASPLPPFLLLVLPSDLSPSLRDCSPYVRPSLHPSPLLCSQPLAPWSSLLHSSLLSRLLSRFSLLSPLPFFSHLHPPPFPLSFLNTSSSSPLNIFISLLHSFTSSFNPFISSTILFHSSTLALPFSILAQSFLSAFRFHCLLRLGSLTCSFLGPSSSSSISQFLDLSITLSAQSSLPIPTRLYLLRYLCQPAHLPSPFDSRIDHESISNRSRSCSPSSDSLQPLPPSRHLRQITSSRYSPPSPLLRPLTTIFLVLRASCSTFHFL